METIASKPRRSQAEIREFRHQSLLQAALITVARYDIEAATVARICTEAGASRGLISHYFDSKEELLLSALRGLFSGAQKLKNAIADDSGKDLAVRIRHIAYCSFQAPVYSWENAAAWQAFTNASRHNPVYRDPIRASTQDSIATVTPLFAQLAQARRLRCDAQQAGIGLFMLIDGLWNSLATGKDDLNTARAMTLCDNYIDGCLDQP